MAENEGIAQNPLAVLPRRGDGVSRLRPPPGICGRKRCDECFSRRSARRSARRRDGVIGGPVDIIPLGNV